VIAARRRRVLLSCSPGLGHFYPLLPLGPGRRRPDQPNANLARRALGRGAREAAKVRPDLLISFNGQVIGPVFGDTQGPPDGDPRELGEASVKSAQLLNIPSSGITGGVNNGVTVVVFSGPEWVVQGTDDTLSGNAQAMVQKALNTLGPQVSLQAPQGAAQPVPQAVPPSAPQVVPQRPAIDPGRQAPRLPKSLF
jgi:hypothetical protein